MIVKRYKKGGSYLVRISEHLEPVPCTAIMVEGMDAGGGILLVPNRGDGEVYKIIDALNTREQLLKMERFDIGEAIHNECQRLGIPEEKSDSIIKAANL